MLHHRHEASAYLGLIAVADGLDQKIAQRFALELELSENVEYPAAEGPTGLLQLVQELAINITFAGFLGHQVPEVTNLGLADTGNNQLISQAARIPLSEGRYWIVVVPSVGTNPLFPSNLPLHLSILMHSKSIL